MNAVFHAWNQYLVENWGLNADDRVYSTAVLALNDLDWAVQEAKWLIENGMRVCVMPMGPANGKAPADPAFDPLWKILDDAGVLVTFHVSEANFMHPLLDLWGEKAMQSRREGQTAWQWMFAYSEIPVMMTMASFIYMNFFERFPNIKMASVENGAEWLPRFLYKMDKMRGMARNGFWPMGQMKERPSTVFKKHCFVVAYPEDNIRKIVEEIGSSDCLLMGSDYPHAEGVPTPRDFADEALRGMADEDVRKIMHDNGPARLVGRRLGHSENRAAPAFGPGGQQRTQGCRKRQRLVGHDMVAGIGNDDVGHAFAEKSGREIANERIDQRRFLPPDDRHRRRCLGQVRQAFLFELGKQGIVELPGPAAKVRGMARAGSRDRIQGPD
jgi:predicted TIM-barrel fold metal-dependent hydrolase